MLQQDVLYHFSSLDSNIKLIMMVMGGPAKFDPANTKFMFGPRTILNELFWEAVAVLVDAVEVRGTVSSLVLSRDKALVGSMDEPLRIFMIR